MKRNTFVKIVPINIHHTDSKMKETLRRLDGVILLGGHAPFYKKITKEKLLEIVNKIEADTKNPKPSEEDIRIYSRYMRKLEMITTFSKELYDTQNIKLPIFGVCLGNEMLLTTQASSNFKQNIETNLNKFVALQLKNNLQPRPLERFISKYLKHTSEKPRFFMSHKFAVSLEAIEKDILLKSSVNILTTSKVTVQNEEPSNSHLMTESELDSRMEKMKIMIGNNSKEYIIKVMQRIDGQVPNGEYVSMFEMKHYPILGVQFHPEKMFHDFLQSGLDIPSIDFQLTNELIPLFFLDQVFKAKIANLQISGKGILQFVNNTLGTLAYHINDRFEDF